MAKHWPGMTGVVADLEGTILPIAFVMETLYPFARARIPDYLARHREDSVVQDLMAEVQRLAGVRLDEAGVARQLLAWQDADAKRPPLKQLQGMIWAEGYQGGALQTPMYPDAIQQLERWSRHGLTLAIYSSGSAQAQRLILGHTQAGDLTPGFQAFFDTGVGHKRETASYQQIAAHLDHPPSRLLFLSDVRQELDAARRAGWATAWVVRQSVPGPAAAHRQVTDLTAIDVDP